MDNHRPIDCIRSYNHQILELTNYKSDIITDILIEYRRIANIMVHKQITSFYKTGQLDKTAKSFYGNIDTFLSERYKDIIKRQIDGMMKSYISNRKNDFIRIVRKSLLSDEKKKELLKINKTNSWFDKTNLLARKIFKHIISKNTFPNTGHINMILNTKVYSMEENNSTRSCSYHIILNAYKKSDPKKSEKIVLPIKTNTFFQKKLGGRRINNSIQLNFDRKNRLNTVVLSTSHIKSVDIVNYHKTEVLSIDFGLKNLFTTNKGDKFGKKFMHKLMDFDNRTQKLQKELQKRDIKLSENKRYIKLTRSTREFIKNEVNRLINRIIKIHNPKIIVMEELNFVFTNMSRRMNRLISNCGLGCIKTKLAILSEDTGLEVKYINPAYTSQECSNCHYTDNKNRPNRDKFQCQCCGKKLEADINASKNIERRSLDMWFIENRYATREQIKQHLLFQHNRLLVNTSTLSCTDNVSDISRYSIPYVIKFHDLF